MKIKTVLVLLVVILISQFTFSQTKGKVGLSGTFQGNQYGIMLPIHVSEEWVIVPTFDFQSAEEVGIDLGIGLGFRSFISTGKLSPYIGLKLGTLINIPYSTMEIKNETQYDILFGAALGAEYFLAEQFSVGIEAQGNLTKSDDNSQRFGNPGKINFNLGTMLCATFYFN